MTDWILADMSRDGEGKVSINQVRKLATHEYEGLIEAERCLKGMLQRTTFSVLLQNYRAFSALEQEALDLAASREAPPGFNPEELRTTLITAVVNYLTSMRMFLDHSGTELNRRDTRDGGKRLDNWKVVCNAEYDDYFAYRFLYRYRNYIQHVGLPLSSGSVSGSLGDDGQITGHLFLGESPEHLVAEFDRWSTVGKELESLTTDIDLSEQIHVSVECLFRIAEALLREDMPELEASVNTLRSVIGDLDFYKGHPVLVGRKDDKDPRTFEIGYLDSGRLQMAQEIIASQDDNMG